MSSLRSTGRRSRPEIKNSKIYSTDGPLNSEVRIYKLSDEELEKYRSGDKERETMAESNYEQLKAKFPTLESLIASVNGISMSQWGKIHGVHNSYFYKLKKEYESQSQTKTEEMNLTDLGFTEDEAKKLIQDINKDDAGEPAQELEYADLYVIYDGANFNEFNSMDEALLHIKTQYNLLTIGNVSLFKEIPFTMNVNVTVGKG